MERLDKVEDEVEEIDRRVSEIEGAHDDIDRRVGYMEDLIGRVDELSKMDDLEGKLETLEEEIHDFDERLTKLEDYERSVDDLHEEVHRIKRRKMVSLTQFIVLCHSPESGTFHSAPAETVAKVKELLANGHSGHQLASAVSMLKDP